MIRKISLFFVIILLVQPIIGSAMTVTPPELFYEFNEEASLSQTIKVVNTGNEVKTFRVYLEDEYTEYLNWTDIFPSEFTLQPNAEQEITVTISPTSNQKEDFDFKINILSSTGSNLNTGVKVRAHINFPDEEKQDNDVNNNDKKISSGGGSGGSSTGEKYENIEHKEVNQQFVKMDSKIIYEFNDDKNTIQQIQFTALKNSGNIKATIEILKNTSTFATEKPNGNVYKNLNIWVGNTGFANPNNVEDIFIEFKIDKKWIEENDIVESSIQMLRYNNNNWNELSTTKIDEDDTHIYFRSKTPGFSPFAIIGYNEEEVVSNENSQKGMVMIDSEENHIEQPVSETRSSTLPTLNVVATGMLFLCAYLFVRRDH